MNQTLEKLYWKVEAVDTNGDLIIRIPRVEEQNRIHTMMQSAETVVKKEELKHEARPKLADVENFDTLLAELMDSEAVMVKANRMTGRNLVIDYTKIESATKTVKNEKGEVVHNEKKVVRRQETMIITEEGEW